MLTCLLQDQPAAQMYQQMPVRMRARNGRWKKGMAGRVDIVSELHSELLGVEVHGSDEHLYNHVTVADDNRKQDGWLDATGRRLLVVWGNEVPVWHWHPAANMRQQLRKGDWRDHVWHELQQEVADFVGRSAP